MAVANCEHTRRVPATAVVAAQGFVDVLLRQIETPLFDLDRRIREMRPCPQQAAQIPGTNAKFLRRLADIHAMTAENLDDNILVQVLNAVGNIGPSDKVVHAHAHGLRRSFSNCSTAARRWTMRLRLRRSSRLARLSSIRPGRG